LHEVGAQSDEGLVLVEAERGRAGSTTPLKWEDEGGAAF
jgi:hypothetical protein